MTEPRAEPLSDEEIAGFTEDKWRAKLLATIDRLRQEDEQSKSRIEDLDLFAKDLEAENEVLRQQVKSFADRIAAQSELLSKRSEAKP